MEVKLNFYIAYERLNAGRTIGIPRRNDKDPSISYTHGEYSVETV